MLQILAVDSTNPARMLTLGLMADSTGQPDLAAWREREAGWPARLTEGADAPPREGELLHDDALGGWYLQIAPAGEAAEDLPRQDILFAPGALRPGSMFRTLSPDGEETAWRIVEAG